MTIWKRLAIASALSVGVCLPAFAADGDGLQSYENEHGNAIERNPVLTPTPPTNATARVPMWNGTRATYGSSAITTPSDDVSTPAGAALVSPGGTVTGAPSAAEESRATGKVDAPDAAPPRTGSDVQAGDMGPSSPKAGGGTQ